MRVFGWLARRLNREHQQKAPSAVRPLFAEEIEPFAHGRSQPQSRRLRIPFETVITPRLVLHASKGFSDKHIREIVEGLIDILDSRSVDSDLEPDPESPLQRLSLAPAPSVSLKRYKMGPGAGGS